MKQHIERLYLNKLRKNTYKILWALAFLIPALVLLVLFAMKGIFPFGEESFLFGDLYHQYLPFCTELVRKLKSGSGLDYTWTVGLGENFYAMYAYYLASPWHLLALLVPESYLCEFLTYLVVVKTGLMGFTAFYYFQKKCGAREAGALLFSCFYALSGYMAAYSWNIMWLDCMILLPLILYGVERLVQTGRWRYYALALGCSIFTNYYISLMICIYLVLYFGLLLWQEYGTYLGSVKKLFGRIARFVGASLLGAALAAGMLIPAISALVGNSGMELAVPEKVEFYFSVLDALARHCVGVATELKWNHWPNLYGGVMVFLLVPLYVMNEKRLLRYRFGKMALAGFLLLSFCTNVLDAFWHGWNEPNSLPARQAFLYIFLILTMSYEAYRTLEETGKKSLMYAYLGAACFLLLCHRFLHNSYFGGGVQMGSLLLVTVYAVLFYGKIRAKSFWGKGIILGLLLVVGIGESGYNMYRTGINTTNRAAYYENQEDYEALLEKAEALEAGNFYRVEQFTRDTKNQGALLGYRGASGFTSTVEQRVAALYDLWGMYNNEVFYSYDGGTPFTAALLNVKYIFGESGNYANSLYTPKERSGKVTLYECNDTLPFGYVAPVGFDVTDWPKYNGLGVQNVMVEKLGVAGELFHEVTLETETPLENGLKLTVPGDGIYYALLNEEDTKKIAAYGCKIPVIPFQNLKRGSVLYLGELKAGAEITLENGDREDLMPGFDVDLYCLDEQVLDEALAMLSKQAVDEVSFDGDSLSANVTLNEAGRAIFSIPVDEGWKVKVNGEVYEPSTFGGALMAFDLEPGSYCIEMEYDAPGRLWGVILSVVAVAVLVGGVRWSEYMSHRRHAFAM